MAIDLPGARRHRRRPQGRPGPGGRRGAPRRRPAPATAERGHRFSSVIVHPRSSALLATTTALAVITVNDPLAIAGLLAGTPLLHTGRSLYQLRGVTTRTALDTLERDLPRALTDDQSHLRERFLTWLLSEGHLWCWPDFPDHNGINGLVQRIEESLKHDASGIGLHYRAGPVWPLHAETTG